MTYKGITTNISPETNEVTIKFDDFSIINTFQKYYGLPMRIAVHKWKEERTLAQNNFLWACIGDIARVTQNHNKWQIYIEMLKRYGKFTHILVHPTAVERFKQEWREVEDLGEVKTENGMIAHQLRVYYGSHLYTTEEMSNLLNGVIDEMKALNIKPKLSKEEIERYGLDNKLL